MATRTANFIDRHRRLPEEYTLDGQSISGGQFCRAMLAKVVDLGADDAVNITLPESVAAPDDPYPDVSISVGSRVYGNRLSKKRYLELFTRILRRTDPTLPPDIELMGGDLRYVDLVHLAARILRFYDLHSYLPSSLELKVTSPINLFVNSLQWQTPLEYTTFTNPLDSDAGHEGSDAVGDNNRVRYYGHRSMDFPFVKLAVDIVEGIYDPYEAANELYDWVMGNWQRQDRITSAQPTMGRSPSAYEWVRYFMHSSAYPAFEITSLFRAAGIPAKAYTDGPKAYFESRGWEEFHVHDSERFWREEQGYQADLPLPEADDRLMSNAGAILARGRERSVPGDRSVWLNPKDVTTRDPQDLVASLGRSGYDRIILTVKPASGNLYYGSDRHPDRVVTDALGEVVSAATEEDIDVAAAVNVLFDMRAADRQPQVQSVDWQDFSTNGIINLASSGYEAYISDVLTELTESYDVDGIVLSRLYDRQHQSMNDETARAFAQETGRPLEEMIDADDRRIDAEFLRWKMAGTRQYAERLRQRVRNVREIPLTYVSYPIPGGYYQLRRFKQYEDLGPFTGGYHFHPEHVRKLTGVVDELLLVHATNLWSNGPGKDVIESYLSEFSGATKEKMTVSYYTPGEWEYPPEYLHALHKYASETLGVADINFHATLSSEGNAGRAFTPAQHTKLQEIGRVPKPPFELTNVSVEPTQLSVGDAVTATARVENTGSSGGPIDVRLSLDGDIVASEIVTASPGESIAVELSHRVKSSGTHTVEINQDHSQTVQVTGPTSTRQTTRITTTAPPATVTPTGTASASTPTRPASEGDSVGGTGPGFGIWSAIGGAGGTALLLKLLGLVGDESED